EGRSKDSLRTANQAVAYAGENYCGPKKVLEAPRLRHLPWLTLTRFGRWDDVLAIPQPSNTNDFLVDRALWHFTRGLAFAAQKNVAAAEGEQLALSTIAGSDEAKKLSSHNYPVADTLAVADHWLAAKVAGAKGDKDKRVAQFEKAVAAQDAIPYMEPAFWPIPVRPALGAALLEAGNAIRAEQVFRDDLKNLPRNGWGLFGLEQSLRAQGKNQQADDVKRQ